MNINFPWERESWTKSLTEDQDPAVESPPESLIVGGMAIAAGLATRRVLQAAWKQTRGAEPPINPAAAGVSWTDALIWAASVGAAVGVSRVFARRATTAAIRR